jgi:hypothetical protein
VLIDPVLLSVTIIRSRRIYYEGQTIYGECVIV